MDQPCWITRLFDAIDDRIALRRREQEEERQLEEMNRKLKEEMRG